MDVSRPHSCVSMNKNICMEELDAAYHTVNILNSSHEEVDVNRPIGLNVGRCCSSFSPDPVGILPADPFGMNMATLIGIFDDYWIDYFDSEGMLPLDPFEMSLEAVIANLMEDLKANYSFCKRNIDHAEVMDADNGSSSDDIFEIQSTLSAIIAGLIEDIQEVSLTDDGSVFDYWLDDDIMFEHTRVDCALPPDPFDMESEYGSMTETTSAIDVTADMMDISDYAISDANSYTSDCEGASTELMMGIEQFFDSTCSEMVCSNREVDEGFVHEALFYALGYLKIDDLLSVEMVCKALHTAVVDDPLLWRCIKIKSKLSGKITDDALFRLAQRSQGSLNCLSLVGCTNITDDGLTRVLVDNPKLVKLCVPRCLSLSIRGIINNLRAFRTSAISGIKHLELGELFTMSSEQYEELRSLVQVESSRELTAKPRFFHIYRCFLECDDDGGLDIGICIACNKYKIIYDCTLESCKVRGGDTCRACDQCIRRCAQCGRCIRDDIYKEIFDFESQCLPCSEKQTIW